jgi:hypothetical protein
MALRSLFFLPTIVLRQTPDIHVQETMVGESNKCSTLSIHGQGQHPFPHRRLPFDSVGHGPRLHHAASHKVCMPVSLVLAHSRSLSRALSLSLSLSLSLLTLVIPCIILQHDRVFELRKWQIFQISRHWLALSLSLSLSLSLACVRSDS